MPQPHRQSHVRGVAEGESTGRFHARCEGPFRKYPPHRPAAAPHAFPVRDLGVQLVRASAFPPTSMPASCLFPHPSRPTRSLERATHLAPTNDRTAATAMLHSLRAEADGTAPRE